MKKISVIKAPYTIRTHLSGAASLHIGHAISILEKNGNSVQYCDYNSESFYLWSKMMTEVINNLLDDKDTNFMLPSEILLMLERMIMEHLFNSNQKDLSNLLPLSDDLKKGLIKCFEISMEELVGQIHKDTDEVIVFVSPSIFFHLALVKKISENLPHVKITLMDEFTFEPATPYFYYLICGKGIKNESLEHFYKYDSYNGSLKKFILKNIDCIVIGEGYDFLFNNLSLVKGNTKQFDSCTFYKSKRIDLDLLPFPNFDDMVGIYDSLELEFTRGCTYRCEFCERTRMMENRVSKHTVEYIIDELKYIQKYNFDYITIIDCSVNLDENYMIKVLQELKNNKIFIKYQCNMRGKKPNIELLKLLSETGCFEIAFGIETVDNELLKDMNKCQDITIIEDMVDKVNKFGMSLMLFLILGFPTEKYSATQNTLNFLIELNKKTHLDVVELEIYHPGIIQNLNPLKYDIHNIQVKKINNLSDIKESSLSEFRPGMACAMHFNNGMNRQELKAALLNYIKKCRSNNIYLETFFWEKLEENYE